MSEKHGSIDLPNYRGSKWVREGLPVTSESWSLGKPSQKDARRRHHHGLVKALNHAVSHTPIQWPKRPIYFFADPHADAEAFSASLVASGGVRRTGPKVRDFRLTKAGRDALFIIGGDFLDKGPSNLRLLQTVRGLIDSGARVKLLAGNHDMRFFMAIRALQQPRDLKTEHMFVRMGPKGVPLLREVHRRYLRGKQALRGIPDKKECRRRLFPSPGWFDEFPEIAQWLMPPRAIERELVRMRKKVDGFEQACADAGLSLRDVYAAAMRSQQLFLEPDGEFGWFFGDMQLAHRAGSFLFVHAGLDDRIATLIEEESVAYLNEQFRQQIRHDLFEFYYGPLANTMRTKYRGVDMPLTRHGVERAYRQGLHTVVHGHRNRTTGQRLTLRRGMLHIESDITMDRNSRRKENMDGYGAGVTIIDPAGYVLGISTDYPHAKVLRPDALNKE